MTEASATGQQSRQQKIAGEQPLVCFSHLRWDFVRQRPQHLMTRFAQERPVWFWEEPIVCDHHLPYLEHHAFPADRVIALRPRLPGAASFAERERLLRELYGNFEQTVLRQPLVRWFYTPAMFSLADRGGVFPAAATVYDCMDELSAFAGADAKLIEQERELLAAADVVFTGGQSLFEAKVGRHGNVHAFSSAVDVDHFRHARSLREERGSTAVLGWFGVIDERFDADLVGRVAAMRPDWHFEFVGPVVKIDPDSLPRAPNIAWLGGRDYDDLPSCLARWDVALMPFALNEATRFISPTKTPEYLAGGVPVVSTPIRDVVADYGDVEGVYIAATPEEYVTACEAALRLSGVAPDWLRSVDKKLAAHSWDHTQARMADLLARAVAPEPTGPAILHKLDAVDTLIVGAGFAGSVMAERLATEADEKVLVVDRREHIGGNAYDETNEAGILMHRYGPHIFHTNSEDVFAYLSRFTEWRPYEHRVLGCVRDRLVPIPINRTTLEELFDVELADDAAAEAFLADRAEPVARIETSEDVVVSAVGRELYELFFQGYTRKQWGLDPSELDKSVTARVPTRTSRDDRYFQDRFQTMPADGYTKMFERMLDHPNIRVLTGVEYREIRERVAHSRLVYTGPIDEFFDYRFGRLPYRSLRFAHETRDCERFQPVGTVNYPDPAVPYTRITEYKHLTGQESSQTAITYEYPTAHGDPYYPIPRAENAELFKRYDLLARATPDVTFVGRLANYRYYNMDQVVGQALATFRRLMEADEAASAA